MRKKLTFKQRICYKSLLPGTLFVFLFMNEMFGSGSRFGIAVYTVLLIASIYGVIRVFSVKKEENDEVLQKVELVSWVAGAGAGVAAISLMTLIDYYFHHISILSASYFEIGTGLIVYGSTTLVYLHHEEKLLEGEYAENED